MPHRDDARSGGDGTAVDVLSAADASPYRDEVLQVWTEVFGPVADSTEWAASLWDRHRSRTDYRLALAHERGTVLGFAWGYTGDRGQYWPDLIARELGPAVDGWVGGHFEFVELAVHPSARARGVGGRLHDALLSGVTNERALLSTSADPGDPAVRLYRSRGWVGLGAYGQGRQVMGRRLESPQRLGT